MQMKIIDSIQSTDATESSAVPNNPEATVTTEPNVVPLVAEIAEEIGTVTTKAAVAQETSNVSEKITTGNTASPVKASEVLSGINIASVAPSFTSTPKTSRQLPYYLDSNNNLADCESGIKQTSPARVTAPATELQETMSANKAVVCSESDSGSDADSRSESDMSLDVYDSDTGRKEKKYIRRLSPLKDDDDTSAAQPYTVWIKNKNINKGRGRGRGRGRGGKNQ